MGKNLRIADVGEGGVLKLLMVADVGVGGVKIWQKSADVINGQPPCQ